MLETDNFNFSFSGLKTAVLYSLKKESPKTLKVETFLAATCHAFQEAVVDVLIGKTERALKEYHPATLVIAGGVSANVRLREQMETMVRGYPTCQFLMPPFRYSLDNASMIGVAGMLHLTRMTPPERDALKANALTLEPNANLALK